MAKDEQHETQSQESDASSSMMEKNFDMYTAMVNPKDGNPIDISSVIAELSEREELAENEIICYIGSGNFAVVRVKEREGKSPSHKIMRTIEYETKGAEWASWRAKLRYQDE